MDSTVDGLCAPPRSGRRRWRAAAALLAPLLLVLSACGNAEMSIRIRSADDVQIISDFSMKSSETAGLITKDDLCDSLSDVSFYTEVTTSGYERDGMIGCRATGTSTLQKLDDEGVVVRDGDKVTVKFTTASVNPPTGSTETLDSMTLSVTFPGKVLSHTGTGVVKGSTVTWTDPGDLSGSRGISATGTLAEGVAGLAWWIWLIIGVSAAAIIGAVAGVIIGRRRRARAAAAVQQPQTDAVPYGWYSYGQQPPPYPEQPPSQPYGYQPYGEQPYPSQPYGQQPYPQGPQGTQYLPAQQYEQDPPQPPAARPVDWQDGQSTEAFSDRRAPWEAPGWEEPGGRERSGQ